MLTVQEKVRRLSAVMPKAQLKRLWTAYLLEDDPREKRELETIIDTLFLKKTGVGYEQEIILPPPDQQVCSGDVEIGTVNYCNKKLAGFGIRKDELLRHVGIFGQTGSGKTVACMNLLRQFVNQKIPFLIFDWKRNYRDILTHPDFKNKEILIFTVGRDASQFTFNPKLPPPGVEGRVWKKKLIEIMEKAYLLGPGASDVLMSEMDTPTFQEMKARLEKQRRKGREMLWHMSSKRTLNSICFPGMNEVVNSENRIAIEELLKKNVILELDGLSDTDKTFIIGSLLLWIYHFRMSQPEREILKHVCVIEEAHHLLLKTGKEEDITDVIMREIRELGEAMIVLDQHPHKISVSALGNCFTKIGFSTSLAQDISALSNSMLVGNEQKDFFGMLKVGQAIIKSGRTPFPFLVDCPFIGVEKGRINDTYIREHMAKFTFLSSSNEGFPPPKQDFQTLSSPETLPPPQAILLEDIAIDPMIGVDRRYKKLGLNPRDGNQLQQLLSDKGLVRSVRVDRNKLFELTEKGLDALDLNGLKRPKGLARGGATHNYYLQKIKEELQRLGATTVLEKNDIDLVAHTQAGIVAVQVETGKSNIKKNIQTLNEFMATHRFMVATNELALRTIQENLASNSSDIRALPAKDFIASLQLMLIRDGSEQPDND